jgi:hypothetical protein
MTAHSPRTQEDIQRTSNEVTQFYLRALRGESPEAQSDAAHQPKFLDFLTHVRNFGSSAGVDPLYFVGVKDGSESALLWQRAVSSYTDVVLPSEVSRAYGPDASSYFLQTEVARLKYEFEIQLESKTPQIRKVFEEESRARILAGKSSGSNGAAPAVGKVDHVGPVLAETAPVSGTDLVPTSQLGHASTNSSSPTSIDALSREFVSAWLVILLVTLVPLVLLSVKSFSGSLASKTPVPLPVGRKPPPLPARSAQHGPIDAVPYREVRSSVTDAVSSGQVVHSGKNKFKLPVEVVFAVISQISLAMIYFALAGMFLLVPTEKQLFLVVVGMVLMISVISFSVFVDALSVLRRRPDRLIGKGWSYIVIGAFFAFSLWNGLPEGLLKSDREISLEDFGKSIGSWLPAVLSIFSGVMYLIGDSEYRRRKNEASVK